MSSTSSAGRGGKLTEAQRSLLIRSAMASPVGTVLRPQDVTTAGALSARDLVKHHRSQSDGIWRLQATDAGRQALAAVEGDK